MTYQRTEKAKIALEEAETMIALLDQDNYLHKVFKDTIEGLKQVIFDAEYREHELHCEICTIDEEKQMYLKQLLDLVYSE